MTLWKAFAIIILSAISFSLAGGGLGYALACTVPSFYQAVFRGLVGIDPVPVGIGLGIAQGTIAGLIVGSVAVLAVSISSKHNAVKPPGIDT